MKKVFRFPVTCLASTSLFLAACQSGGSSQPAPAPSKQTGQPPQNPSTPESQQTADSTGSSQGSSQIDQSQVAGNQPNQNPGEAQANGEPGPGQQANNNNQNHATPSPTPSHEPETLPLPPPPPMPPVRNAPSIARVLRPSDDVTILFTRYLSETHPEAIENARDQVVNEIFSDEDQAQGKTLELKAAISKIAANGLYTNDVKGRVAFLHSRIQQRIQQDHYVDVFEKGVFFVGSGLAIGTLAGSGLYNRLPEAGQAIETAWRNSKEATRAKVADMYQRTKGAINDVRSTVQDREKLNQLMDSTRAAIKSKADATIETGTRVKGQLMEAVRAPFKTSDRIVEENLTDLGISDVQRMHLGELTPVRALDLPENVEFLRTPKGNFQFAVLQQLGDQPLGPEMAFAFRQQRLVQGSPFETIFVTQPLDAEQAGIISRQLRSPLAEDGTPRQFVNFLNLRTGAVSVLRWPGKKLAQVVEAGGSKIMPLFSKVDWPTAAGTAALTTTGLGGAYYYGFGNGEDSAAQKDASNLEDMIQRPSVPPITTSQLENAHNR